MAPRIIKLLKGNKRKNNQGPNSLREKFLEVGAKAPEGSRAARIAERLVEVGEPVIGEKAKPEKISLAERKRRQLEKIK